MKKFKVFAIAVCFAIPFLGNARNNIATNNGTNSNTQHQAFKTEVGDCNEPKSSIDLDINNVRTRLLNAGDMWWDLSDARYEVPKGSGATNPVQAIFAGSIWVSAKDQGGNLKIAANTYRTNGYDFWAGPLDANGEVLGTTCQKWDNNGSGHFNVYGAEIAALQAEYKAQGGTYPTRLSQAIAGTVITDNLKNWPGKGNPYLTAKGYDVNSNLAPFFDADADGVYDPKWGDFPIIGKGDLTDINAAYADQMIFWVMNDKGNVHTGATGGQALGIQVNALAFAFNTTNEINNMTFYRYTFLNKSANTYSETYMSQFVDPDLGCSENDYIGCDTIRSLGYVYNATINDAGSDCLSGTVGYGTELPILGFDYFEGPIDGSGNQLGLSSFVYFNRQPFGNSCQWDPTTAQQFRNYQTGFWLCGRPITECGTGYLPSGGTPTKYVYPGNPANASGWSECNNCSGNKNAKGDRRFLQTSGPFTLAPNTPQNITIGVLFVQPKGGVGLCPDVNVFLGVADDKAQALFDTDFKILSGPDAPKLSITELDKQLIINIFNTSGNNVGEKYRALDLLTVAKPGFYDAGSNRDSFYTFEGYKVYQLRDDKVSSTDLSDVTKAIEIAQMDVKNGVTRLVNYELDPTLGVLIPTIKTEGLDNGISHSLNITKNYFASGNIDGLVNNKTYYYAIVAYASNNFMPYNPITGKGQDITFLNGKNMNRYSAIPHSANGQEMELNTQWGKGVEVMRIEGAGNGNNFTFISTAHPSNYASFVSRDVLDTIFYLPTGNPVGFHVTDPSRLVEADFELRVFDTLSAADGTLSANATWILYDLTNNRQIKGERSIDRNFEQIITFKDPTGEYIDYGFALNIGRPNIAYTNLSSNGSVFAPLGGFATEANISNKWLNFVKDPGDDESAANWIRSGRNLGLTYDGAFGANFYTVTGTDIIPTDSLKYFSSFIEGTWAPYCLAANYNYSGNRPVTDVKSVYGPGFKWKNYNTNSKTEAPRNNLDQVPSVDIVLTSDKNYWTKCVVFEAGEEQDANQGAITQAVSPFRIKPPRKGMLRDAYSWDKSGQYHDGSNALPVEKGRSWFPGYAVNTETGERLNMAFAEASDLVAYNGADMIWNPTADDYSKVNNGNPAIPNMPIWGGRHFVYVMNTKYDGCDSIYNVLTNNAPIMAHATTAYPIVVQKIYDQIVWASIPYLIEGKSLKSVAEGIIPEDMVIGLRIGKPYAKFATTTTSNIAGDSMPRYQFSTKGMGPKKYTTEQSKDALDDIRIVPNPYLAYSYYEKSAADYRVKITNLPKNCSINIYTLDGQFVRKLTRNIGANVTIQEGRDLENKKVTTNLDDATEWDLKNDKGIPISSGIYLFEVNIPNVGTKILRWFGAMRATDVSNF